MTDSFLEEWKCKRTTIDITNGQGERTFKTNDEEIDSNEAR
jgi:hypothetical protein